MDSGRKLWFGGVTADTVSGLHPRDIAAELDRFGTVERVEMKERCFHVTFENIKDAKRVLDERTGGRFRVCNTMAACQEYRPYGGATAYTPREQTSRYDTDIHKEKDDKGLSEDAKELIQRIKDHKEWRQGLDFTQIERMLRTLSYSTQLKALETFKNSDFSDVRNPMGWFQSIVRTLGMGLNHGTRPNDAGFNRLKTGALRGFEAREDGISPRTIARDAFRRERSRSRSASSSARRGEKRASRRESRRARRSRSRSPPAAAPRRPAHRPSFTESHPNGSEKRAIRSPPRDPGSRPYNPAGGGFTPRKPTTRPEHRRSRSRPRFPSEPKSQMRSKTPRPPRSPHPPAGSPPAERRKPDAPDTSPDAHKDEKKSRDRSRPRSGSPRKKNRDKKREDSTDRESVASKKSAQAPSKKSKIVDDKDDDFDGWESIPDEEKEEYDAKEKDEEKEDESPKKLVLDEDALDGWESLGGDSDQKSVKDDFLPDKEESERKKSRSRTKSRSKSKSKSKSRSKSKSPQRTSSWRTISPKSNKSKSRSKSRSKSKSKSRSIKSKSTVKLNSGSQSRRGRSKSRSASHKSRRAAHQKSKSRSNTRSPSSGKGEKKEEKKEGRKSTGGSKGGSKQRASRSRSRSQEAKSRTPVHSFKEGSRSRSRSRSFKMQSARTVPREREDEAIAKSKEKKAPSKDAQSVQDTTPPTVEVIDDDDDDDEDARTHVAPKKTTKASKQEGSGLKKVKKHGGKLSINKKKKKGDKLASEMEKRKAAEEREKEKEESERRERRKAEREKLKEAKEKQKKEAVLREKLKQQKQLRERLKEEKLKEKKLLKARKREQAAAKEKEKEKELNKGKKNLNSPAKRAKAKRVGATVSPTRRYGTVSPASRFNDDDDDKVNHKIEKGRKNFQNLARESPELSTLTPSSKKIAATELINLILRAPNGKIKHVVHKSEATIRDVLAAHGKDPLQYRFLFNGHRVSRDVTVQELEKSNKKKGPLTLQLEKLVYVEIYLGDNVFEERLPGSMPITKLFEDLKLRGLEKNITDLVCQNAEGIEFGKELTLDELDVQTGSSKNTPLALHIVHGDWDSD